MVHFCKNVSYHLPGFHTDKILDMQIPPKEDPFCFCNLWEWWKLPVHNLQEFMIIGNTLACPKSNCKAEHHPEKKLANSSCSVNQCKHWNHNRCISKNLCCPGCPLGSETMDVWWIIDQTCTQWPCWYWLFILTIKCVIR